MPSQSSSPIPVVCAVIEHDDRVLLAQRPSNKHLALKWEFPGGKVEKGETPEAALLREIMEELNCRIHVVRTLPRFTHTYDHKAIEMIPLVCRLAAGSPAPQPAEHAAIAWVLLLELLTYDLAAADLLVAAALLRPGE
jgi:8-oxo-dGTP diphosphatase